MTDEAELTDDQRIVAAMKTIYDARKTLSDLYYLFQGDGNEKGQAECVNLIDRLEVAENHLSSIPDRTETTA